MYIALNSKKQRIHISDALEGDKYYCPVCDEEVIKRKGSINAHHFAHKNNSQCLEKDGWHYDIDVPQCSPFLPDKVKIIDVFSEKECLDWLLEHTKW